MQLYYMNKDGNKGSDSTIVLMTVAVIYKFVLVVLGVGMLLFCGGALKTELQSFFPLYLLGLALNTVAVAVVLAAMLFSTVDDCRLGVGGKTVYPARHLESKSTAHG